jgi:integrase
MHTYTELEGCEIFIQLFFFQFIWERKLPYVPTEDEIKNYYNAVWNTKCFQDMLIIKVLIYTGVRVNELINIKLSDIDLSWLMDS